MAATFSGETVPPVCKNVPSRSLAISRVTIVTNFPDILPSQKGLKLARVFNYPYSTLRAFLKGASWPRSATKFAPTNTP